ncbi:MAG: hypothetical protein FWH05_05385 [Oscillospiraceae bacterium]|nr:hypothetical protein [Oscillospiraceae bacterium]
MRKVEIVLNENRIKAQGEHSLEKICEGLDNAFVDYANMQKTTEESGKIIYSVSVMKDENHYAKIMGAITKYAKSKWFTDNAVRFVYGDTYGSDNPNDYSIEDILEIWKVGKSA